MSNHTRVLVVDNHALIREGVASLLASQPDLDVVGKAANGDQALEMAQALKPDLVLMDLRMKRMDGDAAQKKMADINPDIPVVIMTAKRRGPDTRLVGWRPLA